MSLKNRIRYLIFKIRWNVRGVRAKFMIEFMRWLTKENNPIKLSYGVLSRMADHMYNLVDSRKELLDWQEAFIKEVYG